MNARRGASEMSVGAALGMAPLLGSRTGMGPGPRPTPPTPSDDGTAGWIQILDPWEVRADVVAHLRDVTKRAIAALDLPHLTVEMFRPCAPGHPRGFAIPPGAVGRAGFNISTVPDVVFVFVDKTKDQLERLVAHEIRHAWQAAHNHDGRWDDPDLREHDAIEYAVRWLGLERYMATEEEPTIELDPTLPDGFRVYKATVHRALARVASATPQTPQGLVANGSLATSTELDPTLPEGFYVRTPDTTGYLRVLEPEEVPDDVAERVWGTVEAVGAALDLPHSIVVVFYEPCEADHPDAQGPSVHSEAMGFSLRSRPGHIAIRVGQSLEESERVTVHELRHDWQRLHGHHERWSIEDLEKDAHRFDREWMEARA